MSSRAIIEGYGQFDGKRHKPITPYAGSWADQEAKRPRVPITPKQQAQRRAGLAHPEIANAVPLTGRRDDMDMPVGKGGQRRFATSAPDDRIGPGSTSGILLGQAGYAAWARDMHERGNKVPTWDEGTPYNEETLSPAEIVDRLLEYRSTKD